MLEIRDLSFRYHGRETPVLRGINLELGKGEVALVLGRSGCGKSTFAGLVAGTLGPDDGVLSGEVSAPNSGVAGEPRVGLVQQNPKAQMVTLSVEDEVAFGPENLGLDPAEIETRVNRALGEVGANHLRGRSTMDLSGGEMQRVAIASMLAMDPEVMILDEPTSSLDPKGAEAVASSVRALKERGISTLVVEHRFGWIRGEVDRSYLLEAGTLEGVELRALEKAAPRRMIPERRAGKTLVELQQVSFRYNGSGILNGVGLGLRAGEMLGIMGDNGSGKTTLLMAMMGILIPTTGRVLYRGKPTGSISDLARSIGLIFQNPNNQILESTVTDELLLAPRNMDMEGAEARLEAVLNEFGLGVYRDISPYRLSLGEKRRLNLGSIAIYEPEVYLLDEPFVGQDPDNVTSIISSLTRRIEDGASAIVVTHDPDFVIEYCDRLIFMSGGTVTHAGTPKQVFGELAKEGEGLYLPSGWGI